LKKSLLAIFCPALKGEMARGDFSFKEKTVRNDRFCHGFCAKNSRQNLLFFIILATGLDPWLKI